MSKFILIPILLIDLAYIGRFLWSVLKVRKFQKTFHTFMEKEKGLTLVFKEKEAYLYTWMTGKEQILKYDDIKAAELKNVFITNIPIIIRKNSEEAKILMNYVGEKMLSAKLV